jgi:hypothetical protein
LKTLLLGIIVLSPARAEWLRLVMAGLAVTAAGGLRFGGFVDLALLALDDLLNPLAEFAVGDDSKIASVAGRTEMPLLVS